MLSKVTLGCAAVAAVGAKQAATGTNAGGWLVLEPWITPSLFYRFLGKDEDHTAMDSWTLCERLGPVEGNKLMRAHWDAWFTEDHLKELAQKGVEIIRLPIGDWTLDPYGPYVGCMDGSADKVQWFYDTAHKYGIKVLMDLHAIKDSQNGYDNSGQVMVIDWSDKNHFTRNSQGKWWGTWHADTKTYDPINYDNFKRGLQIHENLLKRWGSHPAFYAFQPLNEPQTNPILDLLKDWYRSSRKLQQQHAPNALFVFHQAGVWWNDYWNDMFADDDMDNVVMDVHIYQAWGQPETVADACKAYDDDVSRLVGHTKYPVWVGEWSFATDNCAHWLGGFNNGGMQPKKTCNNWSACPKSYLPAEFAVDFDRTADMLGPFGGIPEKGCIQKGMCPSDSTYFNDQEVAQIAKCAVKAFDAQTEATFFWTAHNEIEPRWDWVKAHGRGWFDRDSNATESPSADSAIDSRQFRPYH